MNLKGARKQHSFISAPQKMDGKWLGNNFVLDSNSLS